MVKKLLIACLAVWMVACAASPPTSGLGPKRAANAPPPAGCVADTATRIPVSPHDCAGPGKEWTGQDIKRTGATDSAQALQQLDPRVTVHGQ